MDNLDKGLVLEKFITNTENDIDEVRLLISLMNIKDDKQKEILNNAIHILKTKIKKVKKADNIKEANKHVKIKKILNKYNER